VLPKANVNTPKPANATRIMIPGISPLFSVVNPTVAAFRNVSAMSLVSCSVS